MDNEFHQILIKKNLKITKARVALLEILKNANIPLNYEQINNELKISIDKATFYRTMDTFQLHHIIQKFESPKRKWYFELITTQHAHFICEACDTISCIDIEIPKKLKNLQISSMIIKGECKGCQKEK